MGKAKRPSINISAKRNVNPSINRRTEVAAEDFEEIATILSDHAELIDQANLNPEKFYKFHTSLPALKAAHPEAEENAWAVIIPANGNTQFVATFENGQWRASENEAPVQLFNTIADRPEEGQEGIFYIVKDEKIIYLWYNNKWNAFGKDGNNGLSAYQVAVARGYQGTIDEWLGTLEGKSAYQLAKDEGFEGTQSEWIESLGGIQGKSAYQSALDNGFTGTESEWLQSLLGPKGKSAYQSALDNGFTGTESEWLISLIGGKGDPGLSAYEDWLSRDNQGTFEEFLETLKGPAGDVTAAQLESAKQEAINEAKAYHDQNSHTGSSNSLGTNIEFGLIGEIDGQNKIFQTSEEFQPSKILVYLNGLLQTLGDDYFESTTQIIEFVEAPPVFSDGTKSKIIAIY
ncbi:hypothetical protein [Zunongwangia endophytica]|uniref:DUF4214 domain-containing protein n=1 Tax=Zunongwangia endophytica TaxID=1808945 RepID=A0ABV8H509_9FLAO|nr:hypothetical protein [Zunongwangia endophytica]MDN3595322.1 hypothetical protein [Zunongwangia endophytica]